MLSQAFASAQRCIGTILFLTIILGGCRTTTAREELLASVTKNAKSSL